MLQLCNENTQNFSLLMVLLFKCTSYWGMGDAKHIQCWIIQATVMWKLQSAWLHIAVNVWTMLICRHKQQHVVTARSRRRMYLLAKASALLPERELRRGIADCLEVPDATTEDLACQLKKFADSFSLQTERRQPVILMPDEVLLLWLGITFHLRKAKECHQFSHLIRWIFCRQWLKWYWFWNNDLFLWFRLNICYSVWQGHELFFAVQNTPREHAPHYFLKFV